MDLHIKDVFQKFIKEEKKFGDSYYSEKIKQLWQTHYNYSITSRTTAIDFKNGKLTITVNSSPLKHELFNNRDKIVDRLNQLLEKDVIKLIYLN